MQASIFVISLPDCVERQQAIASQLNKHSLTFSWIEGVNGRQLDADTLRQVYSVERAEREGGRQLNPGEIGCALSHRRFIVPCWRRIFPSHLCLRMMPLLLLILVSA